MRETRLFVLIAAAIVLTGATLVPQREVKIVAGLLLILLLAVAGTYTALQLGASSAPALSSTFFLVPIATLTVSGFLLSITRIGIRPDSVGPCLGLVVVGCAALIFQSDASPRSTEAASLGSGLRGGLVVSALVLIAALVGSIVSEKHWESEQKFVSLSAFATRDGGIAVTVFNHEGGSKRYHVTVSSAANSPLGSRDIDVADGSTADILFSGLNTTDVDAQVAHGEDPSSVLQQVTVRNGS